MLRFLCQCLLIALCSANFADASTSPSPAEWAQFRGPSQDSRGHDPEVFQKGTGLALGWKKPLGPGYSSVTVAGGVAVTLFGGEKQDYAIAFDAHNGAELWRFEMGPAYQGKGGSYDGPLATPAIDGDRVYVLGATGDLFALNLKTGISLFRVNLKDLGGPEPYFGFTASPLIDGDILLVHVAGKDAKAGLLGLDKKTGKQLWAGAPFEQVYGTGVLATLQGRRQILVSATKQLMSFDTQTGELLWRLETEFQLGGHLTQIGDDRFFMQSNHYQDESVLLKVGGEKGKYEPSIQWKTREIGRGAGMAVYREGFLYGYSGKFLTCIDVVTGERRWKSRPPGEGFLILVEDHLAVAARKGGVHLIEATPEAYREKAGLAVFDGVAYNPPSYAYGKLYVRSMGEIAAVDVGRPERTQIKDDGAGKLPDSRFAATVRELEQASDQKAAIDRFMAAHKRFPIIENERYVHVIHRGAVDDAAVSAQILGFAREFEMHRVGQSDLFYYSFELDPEAQITYAISTNFENAAHDPLNPVSSQMMWNDRTVSVLAMPRFSDSDHLSEAKENRGRIEEFELESKHTEKKRPFKVYLPAGYDQSELRYPVVYVNYGFSALDKGLMGHTLDNTIGKQIEPVIVVFVPPAPNLYAERSYPADGLSVAAMMAEELVPYVDRTYRTRADRNSRSLMGCYALAATTIVAGLKYPAVFSKVVTQSGRLDTAAQLEMIMAAADSASEKAAFHLEWGRYDHYQDSRRDFAAYSKDLAKALKEKGYSVETQEVPIGEGWGNWRTRHDDLLRWLVPLQAN